LKSKRSKHTLIEIVDLIGGGTPKTSVTEYWGGNIPWLSVKDFNNDNRYVYSTEKNITKAGLENSSTKLLVHNDIIISARGTVGELAMIPFPMAFNQSCYGIRGKQDIIDQTYLYYFLKDSINILKNQTHGSVFDTITRDTFANIYIDLPSLNEQQKIANILSSIDNKIENNTKINHHLEQAAQAIYLQMFSDSSCSPRGTLSELVEFKNGKSRPTESGNIPVYGGNGVLSYTNYNNVENAVVIGRVGAYCGSIHLETSSCWVSDNAIFAKSKLGDMEYFDYFLLKSLSLNTLHIGTSQPLLTQGILNAIEVHVPEVKTIKHYNYVVLPLFNRIKNALNENTYLATLRDVLLPRLMSSELSVADIATK